MEMRRRIIFSFTFNESGKMIRKAGIAFLLLLDLFLIVIWLFDSPGYVALHVLALYLIIGFLLGTLFGSFKPPLYLHFINVMIACLINGAGWFIAKYKWPSWIEIKPYYGETNLTWGVIAGVVGVIGVCIGVAVRLGIQWSIKKIK
jgi:hypothetical protein